MGEQGTDRKELGREDLWIVLEGLREERNSRREVYLQACGGYFGCNPLSAAATIRDYPLPCISLALGSSGRSWFPSCEHQNTSLPSSLSDFSTGFPSTTGGWNPFTNILQKAGSSSKRPYKCTQHSTRLCTPVPCLWSLAWLFQDFDAGFSSFTEGVHSVLQNVV